MTSKISATEILRPTVNTSTMGKAGFPGGVQCNKG